MKSLDFNHLWMTAKESEDGYFLELSVASGHADFVVTIKIDARDFEVLEKDTQRAAFLQAALHDPFQLSVTALDEQEQRKYLDVVLHASKLEVEEFLTAKDHGRANGAISNMLRITSDCNQLRLRQGHWFTS